MEIARFQHAASNLSTSSNQIPKDVPEVALKSFFYSFAASTLLSGGNLTLGAAGGILGGMMTVVESLSRPLFNKMFTEKENRENIFNILFRNVIIVTVVGLIAQPVLSIALGMHVHIKLTQAVFWHFLTEVLTTNANNRHKAQVYVWLRG